MQKLAIGVTVTGLVVILVAAIIGWIVVPNIIDDKIIEEVRLINGSETWDKWADIPFPVYLSFNIFHVTNPDEVEAGEKPIFEERGPYAYKQKRIKVNMAQRDIENPLNTLQYREEKTYFFDPDKSCDDCTESDLVNVVNVAFVSVVHGVRARLAALGPFVANSVLGTEKFIKRDVVVGELLFKGFDVRLYTESFIGGLLPEEFSGSRFGLYKGENQTASEEYNIYTGVENSGQFGIIKEWDGREYLNFWKPNTPCDKIKGTDGSIFGPFFNKERQIDVFSTDLCRSLTLAYGEDTEYLGVPGYRFTVPKWVLEDPRTNRDNMCYCLTEKEEDCPRAGAMSLEGCRGGAPIMMSTPYFLDGDAGYLADSGLPDPDREKHQTFLDIEPNSGVLLRAHKRIQVNVLVDNKVPGVNAYKNIQREFVFPLLWADEGAEMDEESGDDLKGKLITPLKIVNIAKWAILGVGIAVVIAGAVLYFLRRKRSLESTA
ncbi:Scavenger receptor class B member 1 [Orchesella cincta]|uniref:Scavenger receptor class B member 1 n=1 Tax=Orchesella cincta TaxID=48709 RepID=A0A1D2MDK7_ORCCI|nr:Scavenger receptor class B member 1 [Orchesella cincta]